MKSILRGLGLAMLLAVGLFASGCGDDNNVTTPTPSPSPTATPAPEPSPSPSASPSASPSPSSGEPTAGQNVSFVAKIKDVSALPNLGVSGGWAVTTDANTIVTRNGVDIPVSALQVGESARIKGVVTADQFGTVLAKRIVIDTSGNNGNGV
jgi:hypothetical protein